MGRLVSRRKFFDITAPSTPASGSATGTSTSTIRVTWGASSEVVVGVAGYRVYRSNTSGGVFSLISGSTLLTSLLYDDTTLSPFDKLFVTRSANESYCAELKSLKLNVTEVNCG